jgi:two-component system, OmpR family, response regulator VicR
LKVLVIEDDKSIINAVSVAFEFRWPDVSVVSATYGKEGLQAARKESPDVIILDINLPDMSGFDVLKSIREFSAVPVIILTVRSEDEDILRGLETGADDYVIKPFNYLTLLSRVKAVLRRTEREPFKGNQTAAISARLKIDFVNQKVKVDNVSVKLTPFEYRLLVFLARNQNQIVSYQRIQEEVWEKETVEDTDNIRIYVRRLRKKLHDIPPQMILNQRNSGYMFKS